MIKKILNFLPYAFNADDKAIHWIGSFLYDIGFHAEYTIICFCRLAVKAKEIIFKALSFGILQCLILFKRIVLAIFGDLVSLFKLIITALFTALKDFASHYNAYGFKQAAKHIAAYAALGSKKHARSLLSVLFYTLPVAATLLLIFVIQTTMDMNFYLQVILNDKIIGYVENEGVFESAKIMIKDRLYYGHQNEQLDINPEFKILATTKAAQNESELADKIIQASTKDIMQATGLLIDDELYAVVTDKQIVEETLQSLLKPYQNPDNKNLTVDFVKKVELLDGLYLTDSISDISELLTEITGQVNGEQIYIVQKGDSPSSIAQKNGLPLKDLYSLNPQINPEINKNYKMPVGDKLLISKAVDFLQIKTTERVTYNVAVKHATKKTNNENLSWGMQKVITKGEDGIEERVLDIVSIDGIIAQENLVSQTLLKAPITEEIQVGTKNIYGGQAGEASTGSLIWPCPNFKGVSRGFGKNGHRGADITGAANTPILAVDNAVVEFAGKGSGSYWSYGNYVRLRHSNGLISIYAHCNSLTVSTGQYVGKGQTIALMGSTGRSSGNHLHLEIQSNGRLVDPFVYVKRPR